MTQFESRAGFAPVGEQMRMQVEVFDACRGTSWFV